jgi:hypothetical protein
VGTSHFHRIAAYTRCLRCAGAPGRPASGSGLSLSILSWHTVLSDPGEFDHRQFQRSDVDTAFAESRPARHSQDSRNPFHAGDDFRGFLVHTSATVCQLARPLHGSDRLPSQRGFYIRAFSGLVALPAAGYNYNSDWTPLGGTLTRSNGSWPRCSGSDALFDHLAARRSVPRARFKAISCSRGCDWTVATRGTSGATQAFHFMFWRAQISIFKRSVIFGEDEERC